MDPTDERNRARIGVAPLRVDLLTSITGVTFDEAWPGRVEVARGEVLVPFIGVDHYLQNKDATGRDQDLVDAAAVRRRLRRSKSE